MSPGLDEREINSMRLPSIRLKFAILVSLIYIITFYVNEIWPKFFSVEVIELPQFQLTDSAETPLSCDPRKNVIFFKTHKTASSSVQNMVMRYARRRNLTLLIPFSKIEHKFSLTEPFRKEMAAAAPWEVLGYNMLCHHLVFNKPEIEKLMPHDSLYISIIRNPVSLFESLYEYQLMEDFYQMDIEEYSRATKNASALSKIEIRSDGVGRNQLLYDFGVNPSLFDNLTVIQSAIEYIENNFDLIMVAEHFDESVVLLRHVLCWDLNDVISFTGNERMENYKKNLTAEAYNNLEEWNWGDKMLYDHFLMKFNEAVNEFGRERMNAEVLELRERRKEWLEYCVEKKVKGITLNYFYHIWSHKVYAYVLKENVTNVTWVDLVTPENDFTTDMYYQQMRQGMYKKLADHANFVPHNGQ